MRKLISIVIPLYNGFEFIEETLIALSVQIVNKYEELVDIFICDDNSQDSCCEIVDYYSKKYEFIKLKISDVNLGMDGNFIRTASYASGDYLWFCGQDDVILKGAISKVLHILENNADIDFIYMNYSQNSHNMDSIITERMLDINDDVKCGTYKDFLKITGIDKLPTFLPSFIIRRTKWQLIDPKPFIGTQYVQIGVFLSLIKELSLYIVAEPLIKGRVPYDGWQFNLRRHADIMGGFLEVICYIQNKYSIFNTADYSKYIKERRMIVIEDYKDFKRKQIFLTDKLIRRNKKIFSIKQRFQVFIIFNFPQWCSVIIEVLWNRCKGCYSFLKSN